VALAGSDNVLSGSGVILYLSFYVPSSASLGQMTDLTISGHGLGNEFGGNVGWASGITVGNGMVGVALTNALSILDLGWENGFRLEWPTRFGKTYRVEWTTNLMTRFQPLESNFVGNGTMKSYLDTKSPERPAKYYRIVGE
jgi:hypothetical protein